MKKLRNINGNTFLIWAFLSFLMIPILSGCSSFESETSITELDSSALPKEFGVTVLAGMTNAIVYWPSESGVMYSVRYGTSPGVYTTTVSTNARSPLFLNDLSFNTKYYLQVSAKNQIAVRRSEEISFTPTQTIAGLIVGSIGKLVSSTGDCSPSDVVSKSWCTGGTFVGAADDGAFLGPAGLAVDTTNGHFFVSHSGTGKISKHDLKTGAFLGAIGKTTSSTGTCIVGVNTGWCTGGVFTSGSEEGAIGRSRAIALDVPNNLMYVAEQNNPRIQKFNLATGAFIGALGHVISSTGTCPNANTFTGTWCTGGSFAGNLQTDGAINSVFGGMAIDTTKDLLYVADTNRHRIQKFTLSTGAFIGAIGNTIGTSSGTCPSNAGATPGWCTGGRFGSGTGDGMFSTIYGMGIDTKNGFLYVGEQGYSRIQKIRLSDGVSMGSIGKINGASSGTCPSTGTAPGWCTGGVFTAGSGDGEFNYPRGITVDPDNDLLYVADYNNNRIQKLKLSTGEFIGAMGATSASTGTCPSSGPTSTWCTGGTFVGSGLGALKNPSNVYFDSVNKYLYINQFTEDRVTWIR